MSFRLVPKSVTLNGVMAVTLRYFTEFGKSPLKHITAPICGGIYARVYCVFIACTMSSQRKFTFAISSPISFLLPSRYAVNLIYSNVSISIAWSYISGS